MADAGGTSDATAAAAAQEELAKLKAKFADWKDRAKAGVDALRGQLQAEQRRAAGLEAAANEAVAKVEAALQRADAAEAALAQERQRAEQLETSDATHRAELEAALAEADELRSLLATRPTASAAATPVVSTRPSIPPSSESPDYEDAEEGAEQQQSQLEELARRVDELAAAERFAVLRGSCAAAGLSAKCVVVRSAMMDALAIAHRTAAAMALAGTNAVAAERKALESSHASELSGVRQAEAAAVAEATQVKSKLSEVESALASQRAEFERYKEKSSKALRVTSSGNDGMQRQLAAAQAAEQRAAADAADARASLSAKDRTITLLEDRYEDAMKQLAAVQRQRDDLLDDLDDAKRALRNAQSDGRRASSAQGSSYGDADAADGGEHASSDAAAVKRAVAAAEEAAEMRLQEELEAQAAVFADEAQVRDAEITSLRVRLAKYLAKEPAGGGSGGGASSPSGTAEDAYVETLRRQASDATAASDQLRRERDEYAVQVRQMRAQLDARARAIGGGSSSGANALSEDPMRAAQQALAGLSADELRRQLIQKSEQLFDANQQIVQLRATLRSVRANAAPSSGQAGGGARPGAADGGTPAQQQHQYLRAVLLKFLQSGRDDVRAGLVPVLATVLQLTTDELRAVYHANPDWIS